ncbi:MAG TPA: pyridoxal phosphate-dependent aminotransferase [Bryobacteraceae bacterium]
MPTISSARIAASALAVPYSRVRELAELAMRMDGVLKLYFGESDQATPDFIKQAAEQALADGFTFYTENAGLPSLREAIARYTAELHSVDLNPQTEIAITASGVQALSLILRCLVDPGDEALVLMPAWPNGAAILGMSHAVVHEIPQPLTSSGYGIDFDALEAALTPRTRLLLYTSPSNPLGWVASEQDQDRLLGFARRHSLWLVADEVYERLYYSGASAAPSLLRKCTRRDAVVVVQSFSKAWCMTGWRLGWLTGRPDLIARASELNEFFVSCPAAFTQKAGEAALAHGEPTLRAMLAQLRANRDFCVEALRRMPGVTVPVPDGAFYVFPKIAGLTDSFDFCKRLLEQTKVGLAPGVAFGAGGEGSVRLCYASSRSVLEEAMSRLHRFLEGTGRSPSSEAVSH